MESGFPPPAVALADVCRALPPAAARLGDLVIAAPDLSVRGRASDWSVQRVMAHVIVVARGFTGLVLQPPPPGQAPSLAELHAMADHLAADITETDAAKLAALLQDAVEDLIEVCVERPADLVLDLCGAPITLAGVGGVILSELMLHGYDVAFAVGVPWVIEPDNARLALGALTPLLGLLIDPDAARGHTASYALDVAGGPRVTVRFIDGALSFEPPGGAVDTTISADPVAWLLVSTGRLNRYEAAALGLLSATGPSAGLALRFPDLFIRA